MSTVVLSDLSRMMTLTLECSVLVLSGGWMLVLHAVSLGVVCACSCCSFLVLFIPCSHREAASVPLLVVSLDLLVRAIQSTSRWTVRLLIAFLHLKMSVLNRKKLTTWTFLRTG